MRSVAASLAAVVLALAAAGCGGDGAEPGAPEGATLVLDFQPNAVHAGIYAAQREGFFENEGVAPGEPVECFNPNAAVMRAEALSRKEGNRRGNRRVARGSCATRQMRLMA